MPTICHFYGIVIAMYLREKEHEPPHVHAIMQDYVSPFLIENGDLMEGEFPGKAQKMVKEFILKNKEALMEMWKTGIYRRLPPIE